ncbi:MAG TPA: N-acetylmuramoyl-L-alanine amidase [Flavobacteriales bacterium]|nr:N-acetylmuramoyl-L-alanine amidase [Flavobacteriales bacterium]
MQELPKIKMLAFPEGQFFKEIFNKEQIVLHHTASGRGSDGDYKHWLNTPERIATSQIVEHDGTCAQLFNSKYWGYHLGITHPNSKRLNQNSIAIEIDSWGGLTYDTVKKVFLSYTGAVVPKENVIEYEKGFRGYRFFERYTAEQIESVRKLLLFWSEAYDIPLDYNADMWDISQRALEGTPGIWSHTSYKKEKSDIHPQPEMIAMLQGLTN